MKVQMAPTGKIITGHVLDVSKSALEERMRDIDARLYARWNPFKLNGWGCWEIRVRPWQKTALHECTFQGVDYYSVDYLENDFECHIFDVPYLNYNVLERLRAADTFNTKNWADNLEYEEKRRNEEARRKEAKETAYNSKQIRSAMRDFREFVRSGGNPSEIARYWGRTPQ